MPSIPPTHHVPIMTAQSPRRPLPLAPSRTGGTKDFSSACGFRLSASDSGRRGAGREGEGQWVKGLGVPTTSTALLLS